MTVYFPIPKDVKIDVLGSCVGWGKKCMWMVFFCDLLEGAAYKVKMVGQHLIYS